MKKIHPNNLKQFYELAFERHRIYVLKTLNQLKPWTKDEIFQNWFFCNVFRRIDKTTVWMEQNIIKPLYKDMNDLWKNIILYRYISNVKTFEIFKEKGILFNRKEIYRTMREMQNNKQTIVTGAFVCNSGIGGGEFVDKVTYIFTLLKKLNDADFGSVIKNINSLRGTFNYLKKFPGVGNFMSYEYTTDLSYSHYLNNCSEIYTWCDLGLGAVRGMNRLLKGLPSKRKIPDKHEYTKQIFDEWVKYIRQNIESEMHKTMDMLPGGIEPTIADMYLPFKKLTMREVEHWLCEYDKHCRGGSKKRRYNGEKDAI